MRSSGVKFQENNNEPVLLSALLSLSQCASSRIAAYIRKYGHLISRATLSDIALPYPTLPLPEPVLPYLTYTYVPTRLPPYSYAHTRMPAQMFARIGEHIKHTHYATEPDSSPLLNKYDTQYIQSVIGSLLYYARAIEHPILVALNEIEKISKN